MMKLGDLVRVAEYGLGIIVCVQPENFVPGIYEIQCFNGMRPLVWEDEMELLNEAG
jgi:hypothetical protein